MSKRQLKKVGSSVTTGRPAQKVGRLPALTERLAEELAEADALFRAGLATDDGGRKGTQMVIDIVCKVLKRFPLTAFERRALIEPLRHVQNGLMLASEGEQIAAFAPAKKKGSGRPRASNREAKFKMRCVLAFQLQLVIGKPEAEALRVVHRAAEPTFKSLVLSVPGGFDANTIKNWARRHETKWRQWDGKSAEDDELNLIWREQIELLKLRAGLDGRPKWHWMPAKTDESQALLRARTELTDLAALYLTSLQPANIDRHVTAIGPHQFVH